MTSIARHRSLAGAVLALAALVAALAPGPAAAHADTTPPSTPTNLRVTQLSFTWLKFAWNASSDNSGGPVTYETKLVNSPWQAHTIETNQSFGGLVSGASYTASVRALDTAGNASPAVTITFTTLPRTQPPPNAPANLRAVSVGGVVHSIAWDAPANAAGLSYALYSGSTLLTWTSATSVTIFQLVHHDCAVEPGSTHTMTVQAWAPDNYPSTHSAPLTVAIPG